MEGERWGTATAPGSCLPTVSSGWMTSPALGQTTWNYEGPCRSAGSLERQRDRKRDREKGGMREAERTGERERQRETERETESEREKQKERNRERNKESNGEQ